MGANWKGITRKYHHLEVEQTLPKCERGRREEREGSIVLENSVKKEYGLL